MHPDFRDPPQEPLPFCKECGREIKVLGWDDADYECECGAVNKVEWRLRYREKHPLHHEN